MAVARHPGERTAGGSDGLPNYWKVFGLQEPPFFQATLGDEPGRYPLDLFVGRKAETEHMLAGIGGASTSRQALGGATGVGKTTLVQRVKATAVTPTAGIMLEGPALSSWLAPPRRSPPP